MKNILITGANRGLGLAMIKIWLSEGHNVFAICRTLNDDLQSLNLKYTGQLKIYIGDVTDEASIQDAIAHINKETESIDLLVNNAAILYPEEQEPIEQVDFSVYEHTFQVNSIGPLRVIKYALPLVRKGADKLVVNISSEAGSIADTWRTNMYAYCMSKSALNKACCILQNYVEQDGIKVLAVHPGWFSSDMGTNAAPITPDQAADKVVKLFEKSYEIKGPTFVDNDGNQMNW